MKTNVWRTVIGLSIAQAVCANLCAAAVVSQCELMDGGAVTDGAAWLPTLADSAAWTLPALVSEKKLFLIRERWRPSKPSADADAAAPQPEKGENTK